MPTLTAHVTDDLVARVDRIAKDLERSRAWVIKDALRQYIQSKEQELRRWDETLEAIEEANRGELVPADEVFDWLDTWGKPGEALENEK